jgi:hypothetical protein
MVSDEPLRAPAQRLGISALWSAGLISAWLLFHIATDRCWFYVNGVHYVSTLATGLFAWLLVFFALTKWRRVVVAIVTLMVLAVFPVIHRNTISAASSCAASTLRHTADKLETYRTNSLTETYPPNMAFEIVAPSLTKRFYRFEYVPLHSSDCRTISAFLLKARPLRYDCGCRDSFTVGPNGKFYVTREDRDAKESDSTLD